MINIPLEISLLLVLMVSVIVTYLAIPPIVGVARFKKLYDDPSQRRSHIKQTPTLGGVAIFAGIAIALGSFTNYALIPSMQYILVASIIIFFIGLKDDIQSIAPLKKLLGQIIAALVLALFGNLNFSSLHGFFEIHHISPVSGLLLTIFVIIVVINSFNLIDGIDGLATSIGILASLFFGFWFYISGNIEYCLIPVALLGALLGFLRFNVLEGKFKIFMGDTGSMLVGLMIVVQVIIFNEKNIGYTSAFPIKSAPAVSIAVLIIPLYDTLRVFIIRMSRGRSPFSADKNHLHHCMLKLGFTHLQSTILIVFVNICFIVLALCLQNIGIFWLTLIILGIASCLSLMVEFLVRKRNGRASPKKM